MESEHLFAFFGSFLLGGAAVYFTAPATNTIVVYPTPENARKVEYKDRAGTCYVYGAKKIKCPAGGGKPIPLQE